MKTQRCLVYSRFPTHDLPSRVQIIRGPVMKTTTSSLSQSIQLKTFAHALDISSNDHPKRPVARIHIPLVFWWYVLTKQSEPVLYVVEGRREAMDKATNERYEFVGA